MSEVKPPIETESTESPESNISTGTNVCEQDDEKNGNNGENHKDENLADSIPCTVVKGNDGNIGNNYLIPFQKKLGFNLFLFESCITDNGSFRSPLCDTCDILQKQGIPSAQLKYGLLTLISLNSAHIGLPINLVITEDDGAGGQSLLDSCISLTPENSKIQFPSIPSDMSVGGDQFRGKAILIADLVGSNKKALNNLSSLLSRGVVINQKPNQKTGSGFQQYKAEGPTALVSLVKDSQDPVLKLPFILRIHLTADQNIKRDKILRGEIHNTYPEQNEYILKCGQIKTFFDRLEPSIVEISYFNQLINAFDLTVPNSGYMIDIMKDILRNVTIINHFSPSTISELLIKFLNLDKVIDSQHLLSNEGLNRDIKSNVLTASKVDYFITKLLIDGLFINGSDILTDRQLRIFNVIKIYQLSYLKGDITDMLTDVDQKNEIELLRTFENPSHIKALPDIVRIMKIINKDRSDKITKRVLKNITDDGSEPISESTFRNELKYLENHDLIQGREISRKPVKYIYAVKKFLLSSKPINLPDPKDIEDPVYQKKLVKVINPLTGDVVEI